MTAGLWTLLHVRNALGGPAVSGEFPLQIGELTYATSINYSVDLINGSTLTFSMPGNLQQSASIVPRVSDIFIARDGDYIQRFRVVGRQMSESNGIWTANFSCVDYKAMTKTLVLHANYTRTFATPTEQSALCWTWLSESQADAYGDWNLLRGHIPTTTHLRQRNAVEGVPYYAVGKTIFEAIQEMSDNINGFHWDIEPARDTFDSTPQNLYFNVWNEDEGGRNQWGSGSLGQNWSPLVLDNPGNWSGVSHTITSDKYLNVLYFTGGTGASGDEGPSAVPPPYAWYPSNQDPSTDTGTPYEGRWERAVNNGDLILQTTVNERAEQAYHDGHDDAPEVQGTIAAGKWLGRDHLWVGDKVRVVVSVPLVKVINGSPVEISGQYALSINDVVTVQSLTVSVDNNGVESVSVSVYRPPHDRGLKLTEIEDRVNRLERPRY